MEIKGLDYNTQREQLVMPEYGREIQRMVEVAITLPTKEERMRCAKTIIRQMENKNPQPHENSNHQHTLWDHLYLMSRKQLDIDWPFDVSQAERFLSKPAPMAHPVKNNNAQLRHYGRLITELFEQLKTMPAGDERDELTRLTALQMKRDLAAWGHGSIDDERVADDLARFTDGKIQIDPSLLRYNRYAAPANDSRRGRRRR